MVYWRIELSDRTSQYTLVCNTSGGVLDDLLVYRLRENDYMICVNASNVEKMVEQSKNNSHVHVGQQNGPAKKKAIPTEETTTEITGKGPGPESVPTVEAQKAATTLEPRRPPSYSSAINNCTYGGITINHVIGHCTTLYLTFTLFHAVLFD